MIVFLIIIGCIFACIGVLMATYGITEDNCVFQYFGFVLAGIGFLWFGLGSSRIGEERGAYKQLRGEYEITYVINKDSCVVDTIIHIE